MATSSETPTTINVDLKLPTKWEDLTDKQLRYLFGLLANGTGREPPRKPRAEASSLDYAEAQQGLRGTRNPRGNSGDIGRVKKRKRRKWFSRKYYASVMRIKEFYEDNIGETFSGIIMAVGHDYGK